MAIEQDQGVLPLTDQQHFIVSNLSSLLGALQGSVSMWWKTTQVGSGAAWDNPGVLAFEGAGNNNDYFWGVIGGTGGSRLRFFFGNAGFESTIAINDGIWHHIGLTRNAGNGEIFIDGVSNATGSFDSDVKTPAHTSVGENQDSGGTSRGFTGLYDDVRIYDRILSAAEFATIYATRGVDNITNGLAHRWTLKDEPAGVLANIIVDVIGTNDGSASSGTSADDPVFSEGEVRYRRKLA